MKDSDFTSNGVYIAAAVVGVRRAVFQLSSLRIASSFRRLFSAESYRQTLT